MTAFYLNAHVAISTMSANLAAVVILFSRYFPAILLKYSLFGPIVFALRAKELDGVPLQPVDEPDPEVSEFRPNYVGFSREKEPSSSQLRTTRRSIEKSTHTIHFGSSDLIVATGNLLSALKMLVQSFRLYAKGRLV